MTTKPGTLPAGDRARRLAPAPAHLRQGRGLLRQGQGRAASACAESKLEEQISWSHMEALWNGGINAMIAVFSLAGRLSTSMAN